MKPFSRLCGVLTAFAALCTITGAVKAQRAPLAMRAPGAVEGWQDRGPAPAGAVAGGTVYLRPDATRVAALRAYAAEVSRPGSAVYGQWLTAAQVGERFGADAAGVTSFAEANGLRATVSASGLRVRLSGSVAQVEAALRPGLHAFARTGSAAVALGNTEVPTVPAELASAVNAVGGMNGLGVSSTVVVDNTGKRSSTELLEGLAASLDAPGTTAVALSSGVCAEDLGAGERAALELLVDEAAVEGVSVFAPSGCATPGAVSAAAVLPGVTALVISPGADAGLVSAFAATRPEWQAAAGLPADGLRAAPDVAVPSVTAWMAAVAQIAAEMPAAANGRLGNMNAVLYGLAATPGLYTQSTDADGGLATWTPANGLGLVDLATLVKVYPRGTLGSNVSITASNYAPTHGQAITLSSTVSDTSGQGNGAVPSGTVTFTTSGGVTLGSKALVNGTASITLNTLAGGTYSVTANYSGDGVFAPNHSVAANISVLGEATALSAAVAGSAPVGGTITVNVTATSTSGIGTPTGTVQVQPQGTNNSGTYTGTLTGNSGTATATVTLPATQAGNIVLLVSCVSTDPSFTCYTPVHANVTVTQAGTTTGLSVTPKPPVNGQNTTLTATVTGAATPAPLPTGNVQFYDNGVQLGTGTLTNGTATYVNQTLSGTVAHSFTATYSGDNNYTSSNSPTVVTSTTQGSTTTTLAVTPNPPVYGTTTTLQATIAYTSIGTFPTGTVKFYQDGLQVGTAAVASNATATFTSTAITGTQSHVFYAVYNGDTNYSGSTSSNVSTQSGNAVATTTSLVIAPNPPVSGAQTTLTATVGYTSQGTAATGLVQFVEDGIVLGTAPLNSTGVATLQSSTITSTTTHSFFAKYSGDGNYQGSQSNTVVTQAGAATASTTTTVSASAGNVAAGGTVTFTATVVPASTVNNTSPTGTVTFTSATQGVLGTTTLSGNSAALPATLTATGTQQITATYNGDTNYKSSTSAAPVSVTVNAASTALGLTLSPATNAGYGSTVTAVATVSGVTVTGGSGPAGTVTFAVSGASTPGATVPLVATSANAASATFSFAAPAPGTYTVTATCAATNFSCGSTAATASLITVKGNTVTTVTANPPAPVAGSPTTLTATIAPANAAAGTTNTFSGMVTFYNSGVSLGTGTVVGNQATFTTTLNSTTGNVITAVYSGDTNWNTSTSAALTLTPVTVVTTGTLSANVTNALQGSNVIFTAGFATAPSGTTTSPVAPSGTATFYDLYNGQQTALGTAALVPTGPYTAVAQLSTTGLFRGGHSITAVYGGTSGLAGSTSNALGVNITDYSVTFTPASLTVTAGGTATATATVTALNGFKGTVVLGCTPPPDSLTTCSFSPAVLNGSGTSTLTVVTTAPTHAGVVMPAERMGRTALSVSLAGGLLCLLVPRRRRPVLLGMVLLCGLVGIAGCGTHYTNGSGTTVTSGGTPLGTQVFTIVTSGTDGVTTTRHDVTFQVTVQ